MAVGTVCCEPVSFEISLFSWENTGTFLLSLLNFTPHKQ